MPLGTSIGIVEGLVCLNANAVSRRAFPCGRRECQCAAIQESLLAVVLRDGERQDDVAADRELVRGTVRARNDHSRERRKKSGRCRNHAAACRAAACRSQQSDRAPRLEAVKLQEEENVKEEKGRKFGRLGSCDLSLQGARYLHGLQILRAGGQGMREGAWDVASEKGRVTWDQWRASAEDGRAGDCLN